METRSPARKRLRLDEEVQEKENDSFTVKAFYGKREKVQYPHSPRRRKAVNKVLEKISDDNTDSDLEVLTISDKATRGANCGKTYARKANNGKPGARNGKMGEMLTKSGRSGDKCNAGLGKSIKKVFEFHSSASGDSDSDAVKRTRSGKIGSNKKVPLVIKRMERTPKQSHTPKQNCTPRHKFRASSTGKINNKTVDASDESVEDRKPNSEKKFFKNRSPRDKHFTLQSLSTMKKGFQVKFTTGKTCEKNASGKTQRNEKSSKAKLVDRIKAADSEPFKNVGVEMGVMECSPDERKGLIRYKADGTLEDVDDDDKGLGSDEEIEAGKEIERADVGDGIDKELDSDKEIEKEVDESASENANEGSVVKVDSGLDMPNSNDLFSDVLENSQETSFKEDNKEDTVEYIATKISDGINDKAAELQDGVEDGFDGSADLFSSDPCETPCGSSIRGSANGVNRSLRLQEGPENKSPELKQQTPPDSPSSSSDVLSLISEPVSSTQSSPRSYPMFNQVQGTPQPQGKLPKLRSRTSPASSKNSTPRQSPLLKYFKTKDKREQMIIDAGQEKRYGATQCEECGMVYTMSEPADETMHHKFHASLIAALKFPGWKSEHVVAEYAEYGSRVIVVSADSPKYAIQKVELVNKVVGRELGFQDPVFTLRPTYKAFLYVSDEKTIEGYCICEPVTQGYRVLPDSQTDGHTHTSSQRPWYCSDRPEPAMVGINRIWVHSMARRKGIASKLLDCARNWMCFGTVVPPAKLAFSDPTSEGKMLATRYIGTPFFLVYKYY